MIIDIISILLLVLITLCFIALFVIINIHKSLWFQICYTFFVNRRVYEAYQRIKKEGCIYYENFHKWIKSPTYKRGNEIVKLDSGTGVYIDGKLVITSFYNKMVEDLIKNYDLA